MPDSNGHLESRIDREFDRHLLRERGLAVSTRERYRSYSGRFLRHCAASHSSNLGEITVEGISAFMISEARGSSTKTLNTAATSLRTFLRFLFQQGLIGSDLSSCVLAARSWWRAALPRYLPPEEVETLLESCDRTTSVGRRDHAILLLLARLGLRSTEVVALTLDDVDWRAGEILVRGKGSIHDRLPLPHDVGAALTTYLQRDRRGKSRSLFLRVNCRQEPFKNGASINFILRRTLRRAGLKSPAKGVGTHLLRHSLATGMLGRGASLAEIGAVLRHRSANTTRIYAKVDIEGLRSLALPWPLEVRS